VIIYNITENIPLWG